MFTVNRASTKRLKLLVDILNSEKLIDGKVEVARNNAIALFKNDKELFSFCIDEFLDSQVIDLCNAIIAIYDCVEDRFEFSQYIDFYLKAILFDEKESEDGGGFSAEISKFPDLINLSYRRLLDETDEALVIEKSIKFESLEQLSDDVYKFLDKIEERD